MSFTLDLAKFETKAGVRCDAVIRRLAFELSSSVVRMTPVKTGRARANWLPMIGALPVSTTEATDKSGGGAINRAKNVIANFTVGTVYYCANNLPYIGVLEDGSSTQAPSGMVHLSMLQLMSRLESVASEAIAEAP